MATSIYIQDTTKAKLDRLANLEHRTLDGQIHFLCDLRLKELAILDVNSPVNGVNGNEPANANQGNFKE